MMNYRINAFLLSLFVISFQVIASTEKHDNEIIFDIPNLTSFSFNTDDYMVSAGQPIDPPPFQTSMPHLDYASILVKAGRHKTIDVASWYRDKHGTILGQYFSVACSIGFHQLTPTTPDALNFAFQGDLIFHSDGHEITCSNMVMGQGSKTTWHDGVPHSTNNWWVGHKDMISGHIPSVGTGALMTCKNSWHLPVVIGVTTFSHDCSNKFKFHFVTPLSGSGGGGGGGGGSCI